MVFIPHILIDGGSEFQSVIVRGIKEYLKQFLLVEIGIKLVFMCCEGFTGPDVVLRSLVWLVDPLLLVGNVTILFMVLSVTSDRECPKCKDTIPHHTINC